MEEFIRSEAHLDASDSPLLIQYKGISSSVEFVSEKVAPRSSRLSKAHCWMCDQSFGTKSALSEHKDTAHPLDRAYWQGLVNSVELKAWNTHQVLFTSHQLTRVLGNLLGPRHSWFSGNLSSESSSQRRVCWCFDNSRFPMPFHRLPPAVYLQPRW